VAEKNLKPQAKHQEIDVPNLFVIKLMLSLKSRKYVREQFTWNHFYYFLTNEGIEYLREYLHLPQEIVPATLKKKPGQTGERPQGDRPQGAGRGFRSRGPQSKEGAQGDFKPSFEVLDPFSVDFIQNYFFPLSFVRSFFPCSYSSIIGRCWSWSW
jgi:small subunit ribosomal protein S10e